MDIISLKAGLESLAAALLALKKAKDMLPDSSEKDAASEALEQAERQLRIAEAQAAQGLGYQLCQCTFPPQIMLFTGEKGYYRCPKCGYEKHTGPWAAVI